jgi:predicted amidophosphoribosyltransferase
MLAMNGIVLKEEDWRWNRNLSEGICPNCHATLERTGITAAICQPCKLRWTSPRIPEIFPSDSTPKYKEIDP